MKVRRCAAAFGSRLQRTLLARAVPQQRRCIAALTNVEAPPYHQGHGWLAAAAAAGAAATTAAATCDSNSGTPRVLKRSEVTPTSTVDVVVIGSGAAGTSAALSAKWAGAGDVLLLEKDPKTFGGTTAKSGGTFWIPNHPLLEGAGIKDQKEPTLRFMAKLSYPEKYKPNAAKLGLSDLEYGWIEQYYDTGALVCRKMQEHGAMGLSMAKFHDGSPMFDYNHDPENPVLQGRLLGCGMDAWMVKSLHGTNSVVKRMGWMRTAMPFMKEVLFLNEFGLDITYGIGLNYCDKTKKALTKAGVGIAMGNDVQAVVMDGDTCVGVQVQTPKGTQVIEARKGVIFGSGGFSNSPELRKKYLSERPIDGTGACKGNDGVLVKVGENLGLDLVNMDCFWGSQCFEEESQKTFETDSCIFMFRGDSNFMVNAKGVRVMNEKAPYNTRVKLHYTDKDNRLLFVIADKRAVDLYGCNFAKTLPGSPGDKLYIKGKNIQEFGKALRERLAVVAPNQGLDFKLSDDFEKQLQETIDTYNSYAKTGKDLDFQRGETNSSQQWTFDHQKGKAPNKCMCPLDVSNGIYAVIIGPQSLDTKGGPQLDLDARCLRKGKPVPGLYACGNASAGSLSSNAYWSGGATIGTAMVTGWKAGEHASKR